ncbi:hypothetical protein [Thiobacillus sedimenti]|uniref:Uncharacterized protein n=1 Tax=Thiobacillus sedimenti TaxID=3110231 RepID=A0ABZ1CKK6_9PROT|nr:hypothetical protein [Thiobacillus sp. SCUT-2]WRS39894.1 hypothetical protein VA613_03230 [Thiobacillus sp. SCUT-2]
MSVLKNPQFAAAPTIDAAMTAIIGAGTVECQKCALSGGKTMVPPCSTGAR